MVKYGSVVEAKVNECKDQTSSWATYQGAKFKIVDNQDLVPGQMVRGIIYADREGQACIQLDLPRVDFDHFAWAEVVGVQTDMGVFLDIGLVNKDIVLSMDDLPEDKQNWPKEGDQVYVSLEVDKKNRLWAKLATDEDMQGIIRSAPSRLMNQDLRVRIYRIMGVGLQAVSDEGYRVFIHESELEARPHLGQNLSVRVIDVHRDGRLNASMKPRAYEVIDQDAQMILQLLERIPSHSLALHDKSHPTDIRNQLGISKKQFKRAVGSLMKNGKIQQIKDEGIFLND